MSKAVSPRPEKQPRVSMRSANDFIFKTKLVRPLAELSVLRRSLAMAESSIGSPRVGCKRYINHAQISHYRWVNNNDIITRVPPPWLGYRHGGREIYLNHLGQIREIHGWKRVADRLKGFFGGLRRFRIDQLSDHSTLDYIEHIFEAVRLEESGQSSGLPAEPTVAR